MCELERDNVGEEGLPVEDEVHNKNPYRDSFVRLLKEHQDDKELMSLLLEFASRLNTRQTDTSLSTHQQ